MIFAEPILTSHLKSEITSLKLAPIFRESETLPICVYDIAENDAVRNDDNPDIWQYDVQLIAIAKNYTESKRLGEQLQDACRALENKTGTDYVILYARNFNAITVNDVEIKGFTTTINFTLTIEEV
jgi:hypothetical protein